MPPSRCICIILLEHFAPVFIPSSIPVPTSTPIVEQRFFSQRHEVASVKGGRVRVRLRVRLRVGGGVVGRVRGRGRGRGIRGGCDSTLG